MSCPLYLQQLQAEQSRIEKELEDCAETLRFFDRCGPGPGSVRYRSVEVRKRVLIKMSLFLSELRTDAI